MLIIGAGINIVKCNHTHTYKILSIIGTVNEDFTCTPSHGCMETDFIKFSPDVTPHFQAFDFCCIFTTIITTFCFIPKIQYVVKTHFEVKNKVCPPPKNFLSLIEVFRI